MTVLESSFAAYGIFTICADCKILHLFLVLTMSYRIVRNSIFISSCLASAEGKQTLKRFGIDVPRTTSTLVVERAS